MKLYLTMPSPCAWAGTGPSCIGAMPFLRKSWINLIFAPLTTMTPILARCKVPTSRSNSLRLVAHCTQPFWTIIHPLGLCARSLRGWCCPTLLHGNTEPDLFPFQHSEEKRWENSSRLYVHWSLAPEAFNVNIRVAINSMADWSMPKVWINFSRNNSQHCSRTGSISSLLNQHVMLNYHPRLSSTTDPINNNPPQFFHSHIQIVVRRAHLDPCHCQVIVTSATVGCLHCPFKALMNSSTNAPSASVPGL